MTTREEAEREQKTTDYWFAALARKLGEVRQAERDAQHKVDDIERALTEAKAMRDSRKREREKVLEAVTLISNEQATADWNEQTRSIVVDLKPGVRGQTLSMRSQFDPPRGESTVTVHDPPRDAAHVGSMVPAGYRVEERHPR